MMEQGNITDRKPGCIERVFSGPLIWKGSMGNGKPNISMMIGGAREISTTHNFPELGFVHFVSLATSFQI